MVALAGSHLCWAADRQLRIERSARHTTQSVTCELMPLGSDGTVVRSSVRSSLATNAVPVALSFGAPRTNRRGVCVLTCDLPAGSGAGAGAVAGSHLVSCNVVEE